MSSPLQTPPGERPFAFVVMPFDREFDPLYDTIRRAAESCGMYAERVDKQVFETTILDHVHNQLNKADFVIAVLTGLRPDVMYEVGYAVAVGRSIISVHKRGEKIPFDLNQQSLLLYEDEREVGAMLRDRLIGLRDLRSGNGARDIDQREVYVGGTLLKLDTETEVEGIWHANSVQNNTIVDQVRAGFRLAVHNPRRVGSLGPEYLGFRVTQPSWSPEIFSGDGLTVDPVTLPTGEVEYYVRLEVDPIPDLWKGYLFFTAPAWARQATPPYEKDGVSFLVHHYTALGRRVFPIRVRPRGLVMKGFQNLVWRT